MKQLVLTGLALLCAMPGFAQTTTAPPITTPPPPQVSPPTGGPNTPPLSEPANTIDTSDSVRIVGPVTETQARGRLEGSGYSQVSGLTKGNDGVWRGSAVKGGETVHVSVDRLGKVSPN
jgi:hypothetical protein